MLAIAPGAAQAAPLPLPLPLPPPPPLPLPAPLQVVKPMLGEQVAREYIALLKEEYIDFDALKLLDKDDLSELGIKKGVALKIIRHINK